MEEIQTNLAVDELQTMRTAAGWKSNMEHPLGIDTMYVAFVDVMTVRRDFAKRYFETQSEEVKQASKEGVDYCNKKIKQILGI